MSINRVLLSGNLTRDPELRATAGGTPVLSIGLAVNDRRRNAQTGEWEDYPNFVDCSMFGTRAEAVSKHMQKGDKIAIEGKLRFTQWRRKDSIVPSSRWSSRISNSWPSVETSRNQKAGGREIACLLTYATSGTIAVPRLFSRWNYPAVYRLAERMVVDFKYSNAYSRANVVAYKAQDGSIYVGVAIYPFDFRDSVFRRCSRYLPGQGRRAALDF